jgi:hypothetical protein
VIIEIEYGGILVGLKGKLGYERKEER